MTKEEETAFFNNTPHLMPEDVSQAIVYCMSTPENVQVILYKNLHLKKNTELFPFVKLNFRFMNLRYDLYMINFEKKFYGIIYHPLNILLIYNVCNSYIFHNLSTAQ